MKVKQLLLGQLTKQNQTEYSFFSAAPAAQLHGSVFIWEIISAVWIKHLIFMENTHSIQIYRAV